MNKSIKVYVLRVFVNKEKQFGNSVGVILDGKQSISFQDRQHIATKLGFSESVFINDLFTGNISIFNPTKEVSFAGHAIVGTAFLLNKISRKPVRSLDCKGGYITAWHDNDKVWIRANLVHMPPWH